MPDIEMYTPVLETAPEEVINPGRFRRVIAAGTLALAGAPALLVPSHADAAEQSQMYQDCHAMTVLDHRGAVGPIDRIGPNENTMEAMQATFDQGGKWIETDMQLDGDKLDPHTRVEDIKVENIPVVDVHDITLGRTTNGTGEVRDRSSAYIRRLRTPAGSKVPFLSDMIGFMVDHPTMKGQWEFKTYKNWSPKMLEATVDAVASAGLEDRIHFTSGSLNLLKRIREINPNFELNWIGFTTRPNLHDAAVAGIPQVNVTYDQGFASYRGYKTYIGAAKHEKVAGINKRLQVSIRSHANGVGDNGEVWSKGIRLGASQFVVQSHKKYRNWCNSQ